MNETIVAVFDTAAHAETAVRDLEAAGIHSGAIESHASAISPSGTLDRTDTTTMTTGSAPAVGPTREKGFWSSLFGGEPAHEHDVSVYDRSLEGGSTMVTVRSSSEHEATTIMDVLDRHQPIDIDSRAKDYGLYQEGNAQTTALGTSAASDPAAYPGMTAAGTIDTGTAVTGTPAIGTPAIGSTTSAIGDQTLQLSEESLVVGKRLVNRGGTRIRRYVVEVPVEEQVTLHDEQVVLDRRPVTDGHPTDAAFTERTIEMTATGEEVVVGKTSRVVEEVALRKEGHDHTDTVRDTVRKEEVAVEQVSSDGVATTTGTVPAADRKI